MFKKLIIALGIATLTSTSAFAAKASHKASAPVAARKVAQADSAKPADAKGKKARRARRPPRRRHLRQLRPPLLPPRPLPLPRSSQSVFRPPPPGSSQAAGLAFRPGGRN